MIKLCDLSFSYNNHKILSYINAEFKKGEMCCVIGKNGCGKTTLLKLISRLLEPDNGKIYLDNKSISEYERKHFARKLAYLPQITNNPSISVTDLVSHGRFPYLGFSRLLSPPDKTAVDNALSVTDMKSVKHKNLQTLSGGERRRAYIAMLFAQDTEYMLLDEPCAFLDIRCKFDIMELLKQMKNKNKAIITVMHDLDLALKYGDKILVIDNNEIAFHGSPDKLIKANILEKVFGVECIKTLIGNTVEYICRPKIT